MTHATLIQHEIIEAAKALYRDDKCQVTFETCLEVASAEVLPRYAGWHAAVEERNGAWQLAVWYTP